MAVGRESDYTGKFPLIALPAGQEIYYRVRMAGLADPSAACAPVVGHFRTAPAGLRDVSFVWSGDTAGQGWGIDPDRGGMKTYATMAGLARTS